MILVPNKFPVSKKIQEQIRKMVDTGAEPQYIVASPSTLMDLLGELYPAPAKHDSAFLPNDRVFGLQIVVALPVQHPFLTVVSKQTVKEAKLKAAQEINGSNQERLIKLHWKDLKDTDIQAYVECGL